MVGAAENFYVKMQLNDKKISNPCLSGDRGVKIIFEYYVAITRFSKESREFFLIIKKNSLFLTLELF